VTAQPRLRLFLDSNVILGGIVAQWGLDKAVLSLCAARIARLVLAEVVRDEVEENLNLHASSLPIVKSDRLIDDFHRLIDLADPELILYPDINLVRANRSLIRHEADVPVLLSAITAKPDWLLSNNSKHFTEAVAKRTGLRIATPSRFFRTLSLLIR
jgi:predicted nucleic acid-binding protein